MGPHSDGGAVEEDGGGGEGFGGGVFAGDGGKAAGGVGEAGAKVGEEGFAAGGVAGGDDEGGGPGGKGFGGHHGGDAAGPEEEYAGAAQGEPGGEEAGGIGVVAGGGAGDGVDGTAAAGGGGKRGEEGDDGFFVGDGDVEAVEFGEKGGEAGGEVGRGDVEEVVGAVDSGGGHDGAMDLGGEAVAEWVADEGKVFFHGEGNLALRGRGSEEGKVGKRPDGAGRSKIRMGARGEWGLISGVGWGRVGKCRRGMAAGNRRNLLCPIS